MTHVFDDVACTGCGCVCDDLRIEVSSETTGSPHVVSSSGACSLVENWYRDLNSTQPPAAEIDGKACSVEHAIEHAATMLNRAQSPLVYGLSKSSTDGQRAAVRLADCIRANIDTTASRCHGPSIVAVQTVGESTATLGEIKTRSDLVIYWGANPHRTHPRHIERFASDTSINVMESASRGRRIIVVDIKRHETAARADQYIQVEEASDFDVIWALRALFRGLPITADQVGGVPVSELQLLAEQMKSCKSGVVFFGLGLTKHESGHRTVEALLRLVADLNGFTRFYARRMRLLGDVSGADSVLCWQTGFAFSVNLARGYPRYNPDEYSASDLLERNEVDCCVLVGSDLSSTLSSAAQARLKTLPTIAIDPPNSARSHPATVRFTTSIYGVHLPGTAYRMDEVPIPLRAFLPATYLSDADILTQLVSAIRALSEPVT